MLNWRPIEIDIISFFETWKYEEVEVPKVPQIKGFILWLIWNKRSYYKGISSISYYIKTKFPHINFHKKSLSISICYGFFKY